MRVCIYTVYIYTPAMYVFIYTVYIFISHVGLISDAI